MQKLCQHFLVLKSFILPLSLDRPYVMSFFLKSLLSPLAQESIPALPFIFLEPKSRDESILQFFIEPKSTSYIPLYIISSIYNKRQIYIHYQIYLMSKGKVLVSGASGYIASYIIKDLLSIGYSVVGTVRSIANKQRYGFLFDFANAKQHLQIREADLLNEESWMKALQNINYIIHTASPIPPGVPQDQNDLILPAINGTKYIIHAALKNNVKRIVFTSSALCSLIRLDGKIVTQDDWSDEKILSFYPKSKYLAERLFWEEAEKHKDRMEFVSVLPSLVTGPAFYKHNNSSESYVREVLNGGYPGIPSPSVQFSAVDVRDVSTGHIRALEDQKAVGKRYFISGFRLKMQQFFEFLREKYEPLGYNIKSNIVTPEEMKASNHGPSLRMLGVLGKKFHLDNSRSINQLGMTYRDKKESILEQAERQFQLGIVQKK